MKYCKKCRHLFSDTDEFCPECRKHYQLKEIKDVNTGVYLTSASGFELDRIQAALGDCEIPSVTQAKPKAISADAVTGGNKNDMDILVPYSALEKAKEICIGIGAIKLDGEETVIDEKDVEDAVNSDLDEAESMSPAKRATVKIVSAILLIILFCLVIWGTDALTGFIKGLF